MTVRQSWAAKQREWNRVRFGVDTANSALAQEVWKMRNPGVESVVRPSPPKLHPELAAEEPKPARKDTLADLYAAAKKARGS